MNQLVHVRSALMVFLANSAASGFAAMPVIEMAPVMVVIMKQVKIRKFPSFAPFGPGVESSVSFSERSTGRIIPPERAVPEGIIGEKIRSVIEKAYAKPSVLPPKSLMR